MERSTAQASAMIRLQKINFCYRVSRRRIKAAYRAA